MRSLRHTLATLLLLGPTVASADIFLRVPVVTQVEGVVFYRTSLTLGNATSNNSAHIVLKLTYRSPVDKTLQVVTLDGGQLLTYRTNFFEDIIQHFKDSGAIRAQDLNAGIFGTLLVTFDANDMNPNETLAEARTYSPAAGGGTNGIAYVGRDTNRAGNEIVKAAVRNGDFGSDGSTRTNIGFVNEGTVTTDIDVTYRDGATGEVLREFTVPALAAGEVVQFNNIFSHASIPPGTRTLIVRAEAEGAGGRISGYAVQLDNTTNDGAFFLFSDEHESCQ